MDIFGGFHDACIREAHLWTGHWVAPDLSMSCPGDLDTNLRVLVQRQFANPSAIELLFEQVTRFNVVPTPENYDSIIYAATILVRDDSVFWSPDEQWSPTMLNRDDHTWVSARQARWREVAWLGPDLRYGPADDE